MTTGYWYRFVLCRIVLKIIALVLCMYHVVSASKVISRLLVVLVLQLKLRSFNSVHFQGNALSKNLLRVLKLYEFHFVGR